MPFDNLFGRRKRTGTRKDNGGMPGTDKLGEPDGFKGGMAVKPGTSAFGLRAARRKEALQRGGKNDLRIKTAINTVGASTRKKNEYLSGD